MRGAAWIIAGALGLGGCTRSGPAEADAHAGGAAAATRGRAGEGAEADAQADADEARGRGPAAAAADDEAQATKLEGIFDIDRLAGGKRFQGSWLTTDDGHRYLLSYRPMPEHFDKVERRVIVRGVPYAPPGQAILADHLRVLAMDLAPGEAPITPAPTSLPSPPRLRGRADLPARRDRWVQAVGTLVGAEAPDDHAWQQVRLQLDDGAVLWTTAHASRVERVYRPHFGARVTLLGELVEEDGRFVLGRAGLCVGEVDACGSDEAPARQ